MVIIQFICHYRLIVIIHIHILSLKKILIILRYTIKHTLNNIILLKPVVVSDVLSQNYTWYEMLLHEYLSMSAVLL